MNVKCTSGGGSEKNRGICNWKLKKEDPCYILPRNLAELCFPVLRKAEFLSDELVDLAEEISKQKCLWCILIFFFFSCS